MICMIHIFTGGDPVINPGQLLGIHAQGGRYMAKYLVLNHAGGRTMFPANRLILVKIRLYIVDLVVGNASGLGYFHQLVMRGLRRIISGKINSINLAIIVVTNLEMIIAILFFATGKMAFIVDHFNRPAGSLGCNSCLYGRDRPLP